MDAVRIEWRIPQDVRGLLDRGAAVQHGAVVVDAASGEPLAWLLDGEVVRESERLGEVSECAEVVSPSLNHMHRRWFHRVAEAIIDAMKTDGERESFHEDAETGIDLLFDAENISDPALQGTQLALSRERFYRLLAALTQRVAEEFRWAERRREEFLDRLELVSLPLAPLLGRAIARAGLIVGEVAALVASAVKKQLDEQLLIEMYAHLREALLRSQLAILAHSGIVKSYYLQGEARFALTELERLSAAMQSTQEAVTPHMDEAAMEILRAKLKRANLDLSMTSFVEDKVLPHFGKRSPFAERKTTFSPQLNQLISDVRGLVLSIVVDAALVKLHAAEMEHVPYQKGGVRGHQV